MLRSVLYCVLVSLCVSQSEPPPVFTDVTRTNLPPILSTLLVTDAASTEAATAGTDAVDPGTQYPLEERMPKITTGPRNVTVPIGGVTKFLCVASGIPSPHLVIVRDEVDYVPPKFLAESVQDGSRSQQIIEQLIDPVSESDQGAYKCIAANYWGKVIARAYLTVSDLCAEMDCPPPKVCKQDNTLETATCECPTFSCELEYDPVCGADCEVHFNSCLWNETSCQNDYDSTSILAKGEHCPPTTQPEVTLVSAVEMEVYEGEQFTLKCEVSGFPLPTVEWYKVDDDGNYVELGGEGTEVVVHSAEIPQTGRYVAKATNCQTRSVVSRSVYVEITPPPEPTTELLPGNIVVTAPPVQRSVCNIFGDPHIYTFDSWSFHFAGECTYVLAMDCRSYKWIVYGNFRPCGSGTCLESVTLYINYKPIQLLRGWIININGHKNRFRQGETFDIEGSEFLFDGMTLRGRYDAAGLTIVWDGFTSLQISVDEDRGSDTCGICGNNDSNDSNDHDQVTKLYEKALASLEPNRYGDNWKVDRYGICPFPPTVDFNPEEPCGLNYGRSLGAKEHCQPFVENPALLRCKDIVDLKFYYESCLYDYCYLGLLRESNDPFEDEESLVIDPVCSIARSYVSHCSLKRVSMEGWDEYMDCPMQAAQEAILSISCPPEFIETL